MRYCALITALTLAGSFLVPVPAAAEVSIGIDPGNELHEDTFREQPATGEEADPGADGEESAPGDKGGSTGAEIQPANDEAIGDLVPETTIGPDDFTEVATYETKWARGEVIPIAVQLLSDVEGVELFTHEPDDRSLFAALLVIDSSDTPTEYRFENAVPDGHTAELQADGSVKFFNADGSDSGGIVAPWAMDANGDEVSTRYALDGTTLVQTVEHKDAAYPVVADPAWFIVAAAIAIRVAAPTAAVVLSRCGAAQCAAIVRAAGSAVYNHVRPRGGSSGGGRPRNTPTCSARNPSGC